MRWVLVIVSVGATDIVTMIEIEIEKEGSRDFNIRAEFDQDDFCRAVRRCDRRDHNRDHDHDEIEIEIETETEILI